MSSSHAVTSVIIAAAQSVGKVFVIGAVGYCAVLFPRKAPLLPREVVSTVARFSFNALLIPLIFSTIGSSVTISSLSENWFVLVGAVCVMAISYVVATLLAFVLPMSNPRDYCALRIAVTFPNVVALPILVFPSLCEYPVVYEAFGNDGSVENLSDAEMSRQCNARSNTMIFVYFFGWSFIFYSFGHRALMNAANMGYPINSEQPQSNPVIENGNTHPNSQNDSNSGSIDSTRQEEEGVTNNNTPTNVAGSKESLLTSVWRATKQTLASPPFIAMVLGFIIGCITPMRDLFFSQGGALRFLGSAMETLGKASSSITTMVVAASLVPPKALEEDDEVIQDEPHNLEHAFSGNHDSEIAFEGNTTIADSTVFEKSPVMSDPAFGPYQLRQRHSSIKDFRKSIQRNSLRLITKVHRTPPEITRMYVWFTLSRLILAPAVVVAVIVGMDCGGWLLNVPHLAKLVLILNSAVPGASTVVVLLKSNPELHETASLLAKAYLPTYVISVVTIAAWTALALYIAIPDENGNTICYQ